MCAASSSAPRRGRSHRILAIAPGVREPDVAEHRVTAEHAGAENRCVLSEIDDGRGRAARAPEGFAAGSGVDHDEDVLIVDGQVLSREVRPSICTNWKELPAQRIQIAGRLLDAATGLE